MTLKSCQVPLHGVTILLTHRRYINDIPLPFANLSAVRYPAVLADVVLLSLN